MDLSKKQKSKRDAVEAALFPVSRLIDELTECQTRIDATIKVWPETKRTLEPAAEKQHAVLEKLVELKKELARLWKRGRASQWNIDL